MSKLEHSKAVLLGLLAETLCLEVNCKHSQGVYVLPLQVGHYRGVEPTMADICFRDPQTQALRVLMCLQDEGKLGDFFGYPTLKALLSVIVMSLNAQLPNMFISKASVSAITVRDRQTMAVVNTWTAHPDKTSMFNGVTLRHKRYVK